MAKKYAVAQSERRKTLRELQKERRTAEKNLNVMERAIRRALLKKRLVGLEDAQRLNGLWRTALNQIERVTQIVGAFIRQVSF